MQVTDISRADPSRRDALAGLFGRAFVNEPMVRWPLGDPPDRAERFIRYFGYFLAQALPKGVIWQTDDGHGAAAWFPPGESESWDPHPWDQTRIDALTHDGGRRYAAFWEWVATREPSEPMWQLDSIAVEPSQRGRGVGRALIEAGLARAGQDGVGAFLSTGTQANVTIYERCGFRVYDDLDAPDGGPHVWFMRWDPSGSLP